jgi:glutamine synthetase
MQNELLLHAIGGLKAAMAESMLIFAPNANSYRRFRRNSYAPVSASWGINNRTVSLRIPAGAANACHIEHRPSGADANPYLVMGIFRRITAHRKRSGIPWWAMVTRKRQICSGAGLTPSILLASFILKEYFGKPFVDTYCTVKEVEADRFYAEPTLRDFEWYLRVV